MARKDWSAADESAWRTAALRWFLAYGVEANLAEDLTQETLLRLLRGQQRGQPLTRAYLYRVCQSALCDHLRQRAREPNCQPLDACCCVAVAEVGFQQAEDRVFLEQALGQLRPLERTIVAMHHLEEQTFETIAATLGIPVERAKKISQRAIRKMQLWAKNGGGGRGVIYLTTCPSPRVRSVLCYGGLEMASGQSVEHSRRRPFWKRRVAPLLMIVIGTVWFAVQASGMRMSGERLLLIGTPMDLGKVKRNQLISCRVWVFNPSLKAVAIEATPSCGCMVAELPYRQIPPLNGFPVEVQVSTWGLPSGYRESVVGLTVSSNGVRWQEEVIIGMEVVD